MSIDGGATWQNVFHNLVSRRGPRVNTVPIPQAADESNAKVRWRYRSTFGFWWEVDNAFVGNRSCDPIAGGLVVGNVFDANTSTASTAATVTSVDRPAEKGTTAATPDDPNNPDGYYQLFSSLTGSHPFTASKSLYQSQTQDGQRGCGQRHARRLQPCVRSPRGDPDVSDDDTACSARPRPQR